jgi:predicted XRE-type DNA-binding protein
MATKRKAGTKTPPAKRTTLAKKSVRIAAQRVARRKPDAAKTMKRGRIGSSFDDYLREEGTYEETQAVAIKRVLAWRLAEEMKRQNLTKAEMARRMETSRSQLDRLLDPGNADVKLDTLARAARAVDCELRLELAAA